MVRKASLLGFADQVPYLLVDVELSAQPGLRMIGRLLGEPADPHLDDPVQVVFEDVDDDISIPAFTLVRETPGRGDTPTGDEAGR